MMVWRVFRITLWSTLGVLFGLTFLIHLESNRDTPDFQSRFGQINAQEILNHPKHRGDFDVLMVSSGCPGKDFFMPLTAEYAAKLKANGKPYFIVNDDLFTPNNDAELQRLIDTYGFQDSIYFLDRSAYPHSGGILRGKLRYKQFIEELCGDKGDFPFGYGMYLHFENGQYTGWSSTALDSIRSLNEQQR